MNANTSVSVAAAFVALLFGGSADAQRSTQPVGGPTLNRVHREEEMARRVPVTIALVSQLPAPDSVPVVILRRASTAPRDVILLRRDAATAGQLASAVLHLMVLRDRMGDTARVDAAFRLPTAYRAPMPWRQTEEVQATRTLGRLRRSEAQDVPGVGRVAAVQVYLPSRSMREYARSRHNGRVP
jgi:hypothetical protein